MKKYLLSCLLCFFTLVPFMGSEYCFQLLRLIHKIKGIVISAGWQVFQEQEMKPFS